MWSCQQQTIFFHFFKILFQSRTYKIQERDTIILSLVEYFKQFNFSWLIWLHLEFVWVIIKQTSFIFFPS